MIFDSFSLPQDKWILDEFLDFARKVFFVLEKLHSRLSIIVGIIFNITIWRFSVDQIMKALINLNNIPIVSIWRCLEHIVI